MPFLEIFAMFQAKSLPPPPTVESSLIDILSTGIYVTQRTGYFNLSISKERRKGGKILTFNWFSTPVFFALGLIVAQALATFTWFYLNEEMAHLLRLKSKTERLSFNSIIIITTVHFMIHRLMQILYPKKSLQMWQNFVSKIEQISSSPGGHFVVSTDVLAKHSGNFRKIQTSVKLNILGSLGLILILFGQLSGSFLLSQDGGFGSEPLMPILLIIVLNVLGAINVFVSLWLTFPAQIANACLEMIAAEMREIETLDIADSDLDFQKMFKIYSIKVKNDAISNTFRKVIDEEKLKFCIINYYSSGCG